MKEETLHPFQRVLSRILEEWALMMVEPGATPAAAFDPKEKFLVMSAEYRGVFNGDLTIVCQPGFVRVMACNVLGSDSTEDVSEETCWDALKEFANVVSGNYLVEMYGEETVFDLPAFTKSEGTFAEVAKYFSGKSLKYLNEASALFLGDDHPVYARFDISADEYGGHDRK